MHIFLFIIFFSFTFPQHWEIDTTFSYIKYTGNHTLHSWEGISNDIDFILDCIDNDCIIEISTPLEEFDSGNDSRDSNMLYYTESLLYPIVSFKSQIFHFNQTFDQSIDLKGSLNFHGINKEIPIKIFLSKEDDNFWGICNFTLDLDIFNVEKPSLLMIRISKDIQVETKLKLIKK